ncbi:hypothetical protein [Woodsholea maritima]|uniref:hypothetical protein n=1 Tax=Woodsholea maritima TaxID=240237 RepID=UPI00037F57F0|nr:hypothetical protein [Woodsholea maritima]
MKASAYVLTGALALVLAACSNPSEDVRSSTHAETQITEDQGLAALARMYLADQGKVTWDARTYEDGVFTFTNVHITGGEEVGDTQLSNLVIAAPRLEFDAIVFDRVAIEGLTSVDGEETLTIAHIEIDHPGQMLAEAVTAAFDGRDYQYSGDVTDEVMEGFGLERFHLSDLHMVSSDPEGPSDVKLAALTFDNLGANGLDEFSAEGFSLEGEDKETGLITLRLERMALEGLGTEVVRLALTSMLREGEDEAGSSAQFNFNPAEALDRMVMTGMDFNIGGLIAQMPQMTYTAERKGEQYELVSSIPSLIVGADNAQPVGAQLATGLQMLGYEQLNIAMESQSIYDPQTDRSRTEGDNYILIEDAVRIDVEQDISGYLRSQDLQFAAIANGEMSDTGMLPAEVYDPLLIHGFAMHLQDQSLLERGINAAAAAQGGMDPRAMRQQAAAMVAFGMAAAPAELPRPLVSQVGQALANFIQDGGSIHIVMDPAEPVSIGAIIRESQSGQTPDIESWGLTITAEAPEE